MTPCTGNVDNAQDNILCAKWAKSQAGAAHMGGSTLPQRRDEMGPQIIGMEGSVVDRSLESHQEYRNIYPGGSSILHALTELYANGSSS